MKKNNFNIHRLIFTFIAVLLLAFFFSNSNAHAATLKVKYNGYTQKYKGKQLNAYLDNKKINMNGTKGILIKNTVMVSYKDVFKKGCGVSVTYDSKKGKLKFKKNGNTVKLTLGKKTAYVNGKKKTITQAPLKVKYIKKNKTKILVPAKFLAKSLGYTYQYNSAKKRIILTSPYTLKYNKKWHIYKKYKGNVVFDNKSIDMSKMPLYSIGGCAMAPAKYLYGTVLQKNYSYDKSSGKITISDSINILEMTIGSNTALLNGTTNIALKTAPMVVKRGDTGYSCVMVPIAAVTKALGYYYSWDKTLSTANIHTNVYFDWKAENVEYDSSVYTKALIGMSAKYDINNKNIVFNVSLDKELTQDDLLITDDLNNRSIYFDITKTANLLKDKSYILDAQNISAVGLSQNTDNSSRIGFSLKEVSANYYYAVSGSSISIYMSEEWNPDYEMTISKPDGVAYSTVTHIDKYYNNQFVICIPGNHVEYYKTHPFSYTTPVVTGTNVTYNQSTGNTEITVSTSKMQGYKLADLGTKIGIVIDDPQKVHENIVVLDAGHGGKDPGAQNNGTNESTLNHSIIYTYAKEYFDSPTSPVKAYWTRTDDTFITLEDRAAYAAKIGADIFISLHMNSSTSSAAKGSEVYYSNNNNKANAKGLTSYKLATLCLDKIVPAIGTNSRGVKSANYYVIKNNTVPAVLIELGFLSNSSDYKILIDTNKQKAAAKAIYEAAVAAFQ